MNKKLLAAMLIIPMSISIAYAQSKEDESLSSSKSTMSAMGFGGDITVSGFGTLGVTRANTDQAEFARPNQSSGVGSTFRAGVDSNFGLQVTNKINNQWSLTAQGLVRKDATDQYGAELSWAFAKYKVSDDFSLRVGRIGLPVYMISDYRNVGYANTMLRPPVEVYSQVSFGHIDGVDATYQKNVGEVILTGQVSFGQTTSPLSGNFGNIKAKNETALNLTAEYGPVTLRFGRVDAKISIDDAASLNGLLSTLNQVGFSNLADSLRIHDSKASFTSLGATLDWKNVVVQTEYAKRKSEGFISDTTSWYLMGGYRMGNLLPYVSHASLKQDSAKTSDAIPAFGPLLPLAYGVNSILSQSEQTSNSIGVRWDFKKNTSLKVQIDRYSPDNANGLFVNAKPGFTGPVTVIGAAVDFVF